MNDGIKDDKSLLVDSNSSDWELKFKSRISDDEWWDLLDDDFKVYSMYYYYPKSISKSNYESRNRIWEFKGNDGDVDSEKYQKYKDRVLDEVAPCFSDLLRYYFWDDLPRLTLFCVPTSTAESYRNRYPLFVEKVCEYTKMESGYDKLKYVKDGVARYLNNGEGEPCEVQLDEAFWKDKRVVMFDDMMNKGDTILKYKKMLTECGAHVLCGVELCKMIKEYDDSKMHYVDPMNWLYGYLNAGLVRLWND